MGEKMRGMITNAIGTGFSILRTANFLIIKTFRN